MSFGQPCAVGTPDVFTRLALDEIADWIKATMTGHDDKGKQETVETPPVVETQG